MTKHIKRPGRDSEDPNKGEVEQGITGDAAHVSSKPDQGVVQRGEILDPVSGTRKTVYFPGAIAIALAFYNYGSGVAMELRVVFNAVGETLAEQAADADAKVLNPATRYVLPIGQDTIVPFTTDYPCTRIDVYSDVAAETGDTKCIYEGVSP